MLNSKLSATAWKLYRSLTVPLTSRRGSNQTKQILDITRQNTKHKSVHTLSARCSPSPASQERVSGVQGMIDMSK